MTFRTPDEAIEKANNTMYGLSAGVWTDKGAKIFYMATKLQGRRRLGQHVQQVRPDLAVRRLQGERLRPRRRPSGSLRVRRGGVMERRAEEEARRRDPERERAERRERDAAHGRRADHEAVRRREGRRARARQQGLQDVRRRRVRALRVRAATSRCRRRPTHDDADPDTVNVPRGSRKDVRDAVLVAKNALGRLGEAHRVQPRADPLSPRRGDGVASARAHAVARARRRERGRGRGRGRRLDRSRRVLRRLRRQVSSRCSRRRIRSPGRTSTSACPSRWASIGVVAPDRPALLGLVSTILPVITGGNTCRRARERARSAHGDRVERVRRDERHAGRRRQRPHRPREGAVAAPREAPRGHRHRRVDRRRRSPQGGRERGRRQREAREDARADGPRSLDSTSARRRASAGSSASSRRRPSGTRSVSSY